MDLSQLPDWPLLLDEDGVAKLTSLSRTSVRKAVKEGTLPKPTEIAPKCPRWHLEDIKKMLSSLYGLDEEISEARRRSREIMYAPIAVRDKHTVKR